MERGKCIVSKILTFNRLALLGPLVPVEPYICMNTQHLCMGFSYW